MKKIFGVSFISIILIIVLLLAVKLSSAFSSSMNDGKYKILDEELYSDAYIEVKDNTIRFYNIDLNEIYRQGQYENYLNIKNNGIDFGLSDEELYEKSDLNRIFVDNAYEVDVTDSKEGTFLYCYYCLDNDVNMFGFPIEYNSWDKTIQINSPIKTLKFQK